MKFFSKSSKKKIGSQLSGGSKTMISLIVCDLIDLIAFGVPLGFG
jgi:hypothetical protein